MKRVVVDAGLNEVRAVLLDKDELFRFSGECLLSRRGSRLTALPAEKSDEFEGYAEACRPFSAGIVKDAEAGAAFLEGLRKTLCRRTRPVIYWLVPESATLLERKAVAETLKAAGFKEVKLVGACGVLASSGSPEAVKISGILGVSCLVLACWSPLGIISCRSYQAGLLQVALRLKDYLLRSEGAKVYLSDLLSAVSALVMGEAETKVVSFDKESGKENEIRFGTEQARGIRSFFEKQLHESFSDFLASLPAEVVAEATSGPAVLAGGLARSKGVVENLSRSFSIEFKCSGDPELSALMRTCELLRG